MQTLKGIALLGLAWQSLTAAHGSEEQDLAEVYGDQATLSIANGTAQTLLRAPAVATVITAQDILAMGANDLDELLERVPGLHVGRSSGSYPSLYLVRGIYSAYNPQTLMLQNGVPMTTLFVGNRGNGWGGLPVQHIARIEVMLSPASALYGADAYAGVINIITKNARDIAGTEGGLRVASFGSREAWIQHGADWGPLQLAAYLRRYSSDGPGSRIETDGQSFNDRTFGSAASLAPGRMNQANESLDANLDLGLDNWRLRFNYKQRELGAAAGVSNTLDPNGLYRTARLVSDLSWSQPGLAPDLGAGFTLSAMHYAVTYPRPLQIYPPGVRFPTGVFPKGMFGAPETWEQQWRWHGFISYEGFKGHQLRVGLGLEDLDLYRTRELKNFAFAPNGLPIPQAEITDHTDIDPFMKPQRRRVAYAYVQDEWRLAPDWALTLGLRADRYSEFGSTVNPRVALVWEAAYNLSLKLLHGRAFRAPSFSEQYSINNPVSRGNPNIQPETLRTTEAALVWQPGKTLRLSASLFGYAMDDIIRATPNAVAGTGTTNNNTGGQRGKGMELGGSWEPAEALRLQAGYSLQRSRDMASGVDAGYAPHRHLHLLADWRLAGAWRLGAQLNHVAGRLRPAGDTRPPVADYTAVDLSLRLALPGSGWTLAAQLRNALDADIREPSLAPGRIANDLPMAPRTASVEASYRF